MKTGKKDAVSLIVLVITIIIMIILAGQIILSLNNVSIIDKANEATLKSDLQHIRQAIVMEKLESSADERTPNYNSIIPEKYKEKIIVLADERMLYICKPNTEEGRIAREAGFIVIEKTVLPIMNTVEKIQAVAEEYVASGNSTSDASLLVVQYIRNLSYSGTTWTTVAGAVDANFVQHVNRRLGMTSAQVKQEIKELNDPITGEKIDFIHAIASLNGYMYNTQSSQTKKILAEYSAWAGDLCTLMEQVVNYASSKSYSSPYTEQAKKDIENYIDSMLGTKNESSTFGMADMLADADAVAMYNMILEGKTISETIYDYYCGDYNCKNRYNIFADYLLDLSTNALAVNTVTKVTEPKEKVAYLFMGKTNVLYTGYAAAITSVGTVTSLPEELCGIIANKFSQYIENNI